MRSSVKDYLAFFGQFRESFETTGAIAPSSHYLAEALCRSLDNARSNGHAAEDESMPRRILEVGPGSGSVTAGIVRRLQSADQLHLVELNERFVAMLQAKLAERGPLAAWSPQIELTCGSILDTPGEACYDHIISGLPLNNFQPELVQQIFVTLRRLLRPTGTISFFEYFAVRPARAVFDARLRRIEQIVGEQISQSQHSQRIVWRNLPPAVAHQLTF